MNRTGLNGRLAALADRADVGAHDFPAIAAEARRRRSRRRLAAAVPVAVLALAVPAIVSQATGPDRLSQPAGPGPRPVTELPAERSPKTDAFASLTAEIVTDPGVPVGLAVWASPDSRSLEAAPGGYSLVLAATGDEPVTVARRPDWATAVEADNGRGTIGVTGPCGRGWDSAGQQETRGCPLPSGTVDVTPDDPHTLEVSVYRQVEDRAAAEGTYRAMLPVAAGHTLRLTVTVRSGPPVRTAPCKPACPQPLPDSTGEAAQPGYLPGGWRRYAERSHPLPAPPGKQVGLTQRRYKGSGDGILIVSVTYGDVPRWDPAAPGTRVDRGIRPGTDVLVTPASGSRAISYRYTAAPGVNVEAKLVGTDLTADEQRRVVAGLGPPGAG